MGDDKLKTLLNLGWTYFECGDFNEAEQAFKEAESERKKLNEKEQYEKNSDIISVEIKIGMALSQVERFTTLNNTVLSKVPLKALIEVKESQEIKDLFDTVEDTDEKSRQKSRLSALYHECRGRLHFKQEQEKDAIDEAENEFEKSLSYRANPRVYYYLAELYWKKASKRRTPFKNLYLEKTRSAYSLCFKNDLQQKYKNEVSECLERLKDFEKQPKET